jgi:hypothetical protein
MALMDCASQAKPRGCIKTFDVEGYSAFTGLDAGVIQRVVDALGPNGPLNRPLHDGERLIAWSKRQPGSTDTTGAERQKRHRERKKAATPKAPDRVETTGSNAVTPVFVTDNDAERKRESLSRSSSSSCSSVASGDIRSSPLTREHALDAGGIWSALEARGIHVPFLKRTFGTEHIRAWLAAGVTDAQLGAAVDRAEAARQRTRDSSPVNLGFLATFVAEVLSDANPKPQRSPGHVAVDDAANQYLARR